jgi:hypothetical protein
LNRALQKKAVDGALLAGPRTEKEYAKFTLKKGLPTEQRPRAMAIENAPHSVDEFDRVIKEGYGKGEKRLIYSGTCVIKVGGSRQLGKINVHEHDAEKAGFHYDFVAEGIHFALAQIDLFVSSLRNPAIVYRPSTRYSG